MSVLLMLYCNKIFRELFINNELCNIYLIVLDIPEDYKDRWDKFLSETLVEVNKKNTIELVSVTAIPILKCS